MKFGTLRVRFLDGTDRDFSLELPSAVVGRGEGVSILVDDFSVSRRHAALTVESSRLMVEDLGSAAGTFLNGERLEPHVRYLVDDGAELRIGDLEAVYFPPPPADAATSDSEEGELLPGGLHVALASPGVPIDAGKTITATLTVTNRARIVDDIVVTVPGLPVEWYTISNPRFSLVPNAREDVVITLHPPRRFDSLAGEYDLAVHVESREQEREFIAAGSFTILPFESASLNLTAIRSRRDFKVMAENTGNMAVQLDLTGRDDEQAFRYQYASPSIELKPGEKALVPLRIDRKRQLFGSPSQPSFEAVGKFRGSGSEITAHGQLAINPPLQKFKMPVLLMLGAVILAFTAIAILIVADGDGVQTAGAESEYAGVHLCDDPAPENDDGSGDSASDGDVRPDATIAGDTSGGTPIFGEADSEGAPFFAQNDPRWSDTEYARSTELPSGKDWCGTTIAQCGCAMTSVGVMLALYGVLELPDGNALNPQTLNAWFNGEAKRTERGWVSRGYIYGDVIWAAANAISGEIAKANPGTPTIRFVRKGTGSEDEIRAELRAGRPVILEVPGHWIAAVGLDGDTILINDPFYRDRTTLDVYAGKVRSSVIYEPSSDLSAVVLTAPADVKFRVIDSQGRVVDTGTGDDEEGAVVQIPGASVDNRRAWRDPTCIEQAPPPGAGTNQIVLPGTADDYTIEILDTGGQPGSVAVHTYGRDGSASIDTIDTEGAAIAELSVDPETGTSDIDVTSGGTPTPQTTPTAVDDGDGEEETPTPTIEPTQGPPPTPTPTPFEEASTNITLGAEAGQTRVETASNEGFELGDPIRFAPGQANEEDNIIVGFGSMLLATPLKFAHGPGEVIERLPRPPGQGPGLPPGITPPADTGPLEPPSTVGLACSTIYQPSPQLATFICDLQVTGEYTTTRWTLNGETIPDFTGSDAFLMTFPEDTPASVSVAVCNVTICRSVSRQETIDFGTGLGTQGSGTSGSGTGTGTGGTGSGPAPTPVPEGQVVVVCSTTFPITPDGQSALFNCEANFSGDYTSIAWSAPGGNPASKSGIDKTFESAIQNVPGSPVSLSITATVCNFGDCFSSEPRIVGIGRTSVVLLSAPETQVNSGHKLTLMARVLGIQSGQGGGTITPQGGTVQFYVDPELDPETGEFILDPIAAFGPSAPLFTSGDVAVAQTSVDTSNLDYGGSPTSPGVAHTFIGVYSGGTNAFGSTSDPRNITALPPIPDGCDSVDEDDPTDGIVDNTCRNLIDANSGYSVAGGYAAPKNLGAGTVVTAVDVTAANAIEVSGNTIVVGPNEPLTISGNAGRTDYCPGCIRQLYIGIGSNDTSLTPATGPYCVASGGFPFVMDQPVGGKPIPGAGFHWATSALKAPSKPGVYYVRAGTTLDYFCVGPQVGPPENSIARIIVTDDIANQIDIWNAPAGTTLQDTWTDVASLTPTSEVASDGRIILRARFNLNEVPKGTVVFSTNPPSSLVQPGTGGTLPSAQICPAEGTLTIGTNTVTCTPGEARVVAVPAVNAAGSGFTVTARLVTETVVVPHPINSTGTSTYNIRTAAPDVTTSLTVLVPSEISVSAAPFDDVEICNPGVVTCTPVVLTATVGAQAPIVLNGDGGQVEFYYRPDGGDNDDWVLLGTDTTVVNGEATFDVTPGFGTGTVGDFEFQARFLRGTTNLEPSSSDPSNVVTFIRVEPTVTVNNDLSPTNPIVGESITISATVAGGNGYTPTGGEVQFRVRAASDTDASDEEDLGVPVALVETAGVWTATLPATATGADGTVLEASGSYVITADFLGTATLSPETSANFPFTLSLGSPSLTLSFVSGASMTVGDSNVVRAVLGNPGSVNASRFDDNGATIQFREGATVLATVSVANIGGVGYAAEFNANILGADTYDITAYYSGNNYFGTATSNTSALVIQQFVPTVTMQTPNAVQVGNNLSLTATVPGTGVRSPAGGSISFYLGSVSAANLLGTDTSLSNGSGTYTANLTVPTGGTDNGAAPPEVTTAGTSYTIIAVFDGNATNGNLAASSSTADTTNSKSVTLTKRTPTVTMQAASGVLGSNVSFTATIASGAASVSTACTACVQFKVGTDFASAVNVGSPESVAGNTATLANVATGVAPFAANGTYTIWAEYLGNANLNTDNDSATLTLGPPPPTVSLVGTSMPLNGSGTLVATITPPAGRNPTCSNCVQFKVGASAETGTTVATGSVSFVDAASAYQSSVVINGGSTGFPTIAGSPYTVWAVYAPSGGTGTGSANDDVGGPATSNSATVTVTARTVTFSSVSAPTSGPVGTAVTLSAALTPTGATGSVSFYSGTTLLGTDSTIVSGAASISWTPTQAGSYTIRAEYTSDDTTNYASQATSPTDSITINPVTASMNVTAATITLGGAAHNLTATVSSTQGSPLCTSCVTFRIGSSTGALIGTASVVSAGGGNFHAQFSITPGTTAGFLESGSVTVWAGFGTSTDGNVSGGNDTGTITINKATPTLTVTYPPGNTAAEGASAVIRVTLSGYNNDNFTADGAQIFFRHNGSTMTGGTQTIVDLDPGAGVLWGAEFNTQNLADGSYNITIRYSTNRYYAEVITSPAVTLTITP